MKAMVFDWHKRGDTFQKCHVDAMVVPIPEERLTGGGFAVSYIREHSHLNLQVILENESAAEFARAIDATGHGWIPVGDSMPVSDVSVLLCTDHPSGGMCDGWWSNRTGWSHASVTHWRPLPGRPV